MAFNVKRRGKVTYYYEGERPVLSALVTEEQPDGDLKIFFSGLTGAYSAKNMLGLDELVTMDPIREVPLVFQCWEKWLRDAGLGESLAEVDFLEIHAFACQPKAPNPLRRPGRVRRRARAPAHCLPRGLRRLLRRSPARQRPAGALHRAGCRRSRPGRLVRVLRHRTAAARPPRVAKGRLETGGPPAAAGRYGCWSGAVYVVAVPIRQVSPFWLRTVVASLQMGLSSRTWVTSTRPVMVSPT